MSAQPKLLRNNESKTKKQKSVSRAVLEIVELQGLSGITHSKVSRRAKVSRGWIYEYIGKEKDDLVTFATEIFAQKFARIANRLPENLSAIRKQLDDGVHFLFDCAMDEPVVIQIYFQCRGKANAISAIIEGYEKKWLQSTAGKLEQFSKLPKDQCLRFAHLMAALRLGVCHQIVTAKDPIAARQAAETTFKELHALIEVPFASNKKGVL